MEVLALLSLLQEQRLGTKAPGGSGLVREAHVFGGSPRSAAGSREDVSGMFGCEDDMGVMGAMTPMNP